MDKRELSTEDIRHIAFTPTDQNHNSDWMAHRYGKLTSSKFGRAISVMRNTNSKNIQRLREDINAPKNLDNVPAIN